MDNRSHWEKLRDSKKMDELLERVLRKEGKLTDALNFAKSISPGISSDNFYKYWSNWRKQKLAEEATQRQLVREYTGKGGGSEGRV